MTIHVDLRGTRPHALVIREAQSFHAQLEQRAFWWKFSTDRRDLLVKQHTQRLVRTLLQDEERARMDEVHASRASRRAERAQDLSRLDRMDGLR